MEIKGKAIVLTNGVYNTKSAKTAHGLVRGSSRFDILGIIDNKYIKCSKCRLKYKNNGIDKAHDFGYNRLGEQLKTCFICRDKQKKKREDSKKEEKQNNDKEITDEHYDEVDKELRPKYEEEFKELLNTIIGIDRLDIAVESMKEVLKEFRKDIQAKHDFDDTQIEQLENKINEFENEIINSKPWI